MSEHYSLGTLTILINDVRESQKEIEKKLELIDENTFRNSQSYTYLQGLVLDVIERHEKHIAEEKQQDESERLLLIQREKSKFFIFLKENEQAIKIIIMGIVALIVLFRVGIDAAIEIVRSWLHI